MEPVSLFQLATHQAKWLSARQNAVASNIANVNTPGYRSVDAESFSRLLGASHVSAARTDPGHLGGSARNVSFDLVETGGAQRPNEASNVVMEEELVKSSEIRSSFELNAAIVKAFHRMITQVARG